VKKCEKGEKLIVEKIIRRRIFKRNTIGMEKIITKVKEFYEAIESEKQKLMEERKKLEKEKSQFETSLSSAKITPLPKNIRLDIGGTIFEVPLEVLQNNKSGFFSTMFSGKFPLQEQEDHSYFLDRDPTSFTYVLRVLTGQELNISQLSPMDMDLLKQDAEFYQIAELKERFAKKDEPPALQKYATDTWEDLDTSKKFGMLYNIMDSGQTCQKVRNPETKTNIRGRTVFSKGVQCFKIIFAEVNSTYMRNEGVGFANKNSECFAKCGLNFPGGFFVNAKGKVYADGLKLQKLNEKIIKNSILFLTLNLDSKTVIVKLNNKEVSFKWNTCSSEVYLTASFSKTDWKLTIGN